MLHLFLQSDVLSGFRDQFAQLDFQEGGLSWEKKINPKWDPRPSQDSTDVWITTESCRN